MRCMMAVPTVLVAMAVAGPVTGQTIHVVDADTVERDGVRWRVAGLDAPEIHGAKCQEERRRGILAAARLVALLAERGGRLIEAGKGEKYGRKVGRLMIGWPSQGDEDWATISIREGHGVAYNGKGPRPTWCRQ